MTGFSGGSLLAALPWIGGTVLVLIAVTAAVGISIGRHNVVDTAWGLLFVGVGISSLITSQGHGDPVRRWLLAAMVTIWGLRLGVHIGRRAIGKGEDPRYGQLLSKGHSNPTVNALLKVYLAQAVLAFLISAPLQVGSFTFGGVGVLGLVGVLVWAVGLFFEAVGDAQMERYKKWKSAQPAADVEDSVIDRGLWRLTRHPNYFGDACVWTGIFLVAAEHWPGILSLPATAIMIYLLTLGSGKRNLERSMIKRLGYPEYMQRTSGFLPLPAKRSPEGPVVKQPDPADISILKR